jgi:arsenite methyltransferase
MKKQDEIRKSVSESYANAVKGTKGKGCCDSSCCMPDPKGVIAKMAGYSPEELKTLPSDAVINSFGCGNPLALSGVKAGDVVLDLGSGAGIDILLAAIKVGPTGRSIGIDMTDAMITKAGENIRKSGLKNVEVRKGIIEDLPVESSSVDWVISNCVINLSPEKEKVFKEISRVLRPGGRISVSDIVAEELPAIIRENKALYSSCISGAISEEKYIKGLEIAGLEEVKVTERLVYDVSQLKEFLRSEESPSVGKNLTDDELAQMAKDLKGKIWSAKFTAVKKRSK